MEAELTLMNLFMDFWELKKNPWPGFQWKGRAASHLWLRRSKWREELLLVTTTVMSFFFSSSTSQTARLFPCSTEGAARIDLFLPPHASAGIWTQISRVAPRPGTFWRMLYQLSYNAAAAKVLSLQWVFFPLQAWRGGFEPSLMSRWGLAGLLFDLWFQR